MDYYGSREVLQRNIKWNLLNSHTSFSGIGGGGASDAAEDGLGVGGRQVEGLDPGHVGHEVAVQGVEVGDLE